jgi:acetylornithine deacetylase/succinyl-diaminopimelate desuccinylase-like protein
MRLAAAVLFGVGLLAGAAQTQEAPLRPDQVAFREIYKELVETNTTLSAGDCTAAAGRLAARLKAGGFADGDVHVLIASEHPKEGSLMAVIKGSDPEAGAVLLLGHLDVVEARQEDWTRDPFVLIEEGGYFYGRGVLDMKALDAIWVDTVIRLKQSGRAPKATLKLALTCGEETAEAFNGADWLLKTHAGLIAADFVLNEGGGGRLTPSGDREVLYLGAGEKAAQNYRLTVTNPGGHSSRPRPDNAIYQLAEALLKIRAHVFPTRLNETTRGQFALRAQRGDAAGEALKRLLADPSDVAAARAATTDVEINSILQTNCVATRLDAGHANNALPQRATAIVNCRIMPGETVEGTRDTLVALIGDPQVSVEIVKPVRPIAVNPPLDPKVVGPMRKLAAKHFPGVPLTPSMLAGATDGRYFGMANTPVYGVPGIFGDPDGNGVHGLNERVRVRSVYEGRDYLFDLVKTYVGAH